MRKCKNCSYKLMPYDAPQCPQCGSREILVIGDNIEATITSKAPQNTIKSSQSIELDELKNTIRGQQGDMETPTLGDSNQNCPKCSYPIQNNASKCPNCNSQINEVRAHQIGTQQPTISLRSIANLEDEKSRKKIKLIPLAEDGNELNVSVKNGISTILKRDDIDKNDESLSQSAHIEFILDEDKLLIKNLASNLAVFKLVKNVEEINDNDVLLLGKNQYYTIKL